MSTSNHDIYINISANNKARKEIDDLKASVKGAKSETSSFNEQVKGATNESQTFGQTTKGVLGRVGKGWNGISQSLQSVGRSHRAMSMGAVAGFMDMAKTSSDYGSTIVAITKLSDDQIFKELDRADAMELVKSSVDELASSYRTLTKQQIAEQFLDIARAGYGVEDAMIISDSAMKLSVATGEDLTGVTEILVKSMGAFGLGAEDASRMALVLAGSANASTSDVSDMIPALNMVGATAHASGISFEETANAIAFMDSKGVQASTGARALRTMLVNMTDASNGGTSALAELGFEMDENGLKYDGLSDMIGKYKEATANLTEEQKRNIAMQLGGKEAMSGILAIMGEADVAFDEHGNQVEGTSRTYEEFAQEVSEFTQEDLEDLKKSMEDENSWGKFVAQVDNAKLALAEALAPSIEAVVEKLLEFIEKLQDPEFVQHVADIIEMGVKYLFLTQVLGTVGTVMGIISSVFSILGGIISFVSGVASAFTAVMGFLAPVIAFLASPIGIVIGVLALLAGAVIKTWDTSKSFGDNMKALWDNIVEWVTNPIETINNVLQWFADKMTWLTEPVGKAWDTIKSLFKLGSKSADKDTKEMSKSVEKNTLDASKQAEKNAKEINKGVDKGTKDASKSADLNTSQITTDVSKNLSEASNESMKQGQEIAKGLNKGMEDASKGVSKSLETITSDINKGTSEWDSSFSKGMNNMSNIANKSTSKIQNDMSNMMSRVVSIVMSGSMSASSGFSAGMSAMIGYSYNITNSVASILYGRLGSINLYSTGANVMISFANGMYSQMGAVASASAYAGSLARANSSLMYDDYAESYGVSAEGVTLSTFGSISGGSVSNPMAVSSKSFALKTPKSNESRDSDNPIHITIYETVDGEGITRVVNEHNDRSRLRIKTVRG